MPQPEFFVITGPNAAGKSSFIRSRLNDFAGFEVIMTDVYKDRTKSVFDQAIVERKNIVFETVFNNSSFKTFIEVAKKAGYKTNLIVLFLDSPKQSLNRVVTRFLEQNGLEISKCNVEINFNENFKNVAFYHFYFDRVDFIYTGIKGGNRNVMTLIGLDVQSYQSNSYRFIEAFAKFSFKNDRLSEEAYQIIIKNDNFKIK
jgi:predicted ABC-type ATPase